MSNPTTPFSWQMPTATDLVTDLPADFEVFGQAVATSLADLLGGTTGQALVKASDTDMDFTWATAASGGMTLISTTTLTGASTTISSIPATYKNLQLVLQNMRCASDETAFRFRVNSDSATRYNFQSFYETANTLTFSTDYIQLVASVDNGTSTALSITNVPDYANTGTWKMFISNTLANNATTPTSAQVNNTVAYYNQTGAINSFTIFCAAGNITSGTALLYGVK